MTTICRTPKRPRWSGSTWSGRGGAIASAFLLPEIASHLPELFGPLEEPSLTRGLLFTRRARVFHAVNLPARNLELSTLLSSVGFFPGACRALARPSSTSRRMASGRDGWGFGWPLIHSSIWTSSAGGTRTPMREAPTLGRPRRFFLLSETIDDAINNC